MRFSLGGFLKSIRAKLIFVVVLIVVVSFVTILVSNLQLIVQDKRQTLVESNRQVSELVSRFVDNQVETYRSKIQKIFETWRADPSENINPSMFGDFVWIEFIDWRGQSQFEWYDFDKLSELKISVNRLLGKRNRDSLYSEVKQVLSSSNNWLMFNSTVDPFLPTFLLATPIEDKEGSQFVVLAEVSASSLYSQIYSREGQRLLLIDSHQNILLSTQKSWDPSKIILKDSVLLDRVKGLERGEETLDTISYDHEEDQITFIKKFKSGAGLSLILQEPASNLTGGITRIQIQSAVVAFIVLILVINVVIFMAHRMTGPIKKLNDLMQKVGKGEFAGRIKVSSKDEIGQLANMFNKMLTDLSQREEEINRAKQKLIQSEKMSAFGQMSAGIAHEVKNPLAGILGYAQMAKKKLEDRPELLNYMEIIEKETNRCKEIVENLMKFARQEKANLARIDINKAVRDSVRLVEHQITVSGIKLNQTYARDGQPVYVSGNANQIQQVMLNLMLNAQHAMESKGTLTVSTHFDEKKSKVMILVSDTGCGIPPDVVARIFEPFFTTKGVGKGTGLGLSVSLGIIKDHKGSLDVDSTEGKGTTFTITLPATQASSDAEVQNEATETEAKAG